MSSDAIDELLPSERARFDEVCRFGQDKLEAIAATVARAFADDPIWKWLYDRPGQIDFDTAVAMARLLVANRAPADEMHGFRHFGAVALWTAPVERRHDERVADDHGPGEFAANAAAARYRNVFAAQLGDRIALAQKLGAAIEQSHPDEPHWYLGILATDPPRQNEGLGSRLLAAMHARCDRTGVAAYLVSTNPRNYGFYRRHGYVAREEFSAADSPPMLPFWRAPR